MERRVTPRRELSLEAHFWVRDSFSGNQLTPEHTVIILDLSPNGCCLALDRLDCGGFHLHRCLEDPEDYPVELRISQDGEPELLVRGEVKWINREMAADGPPFRVGLRLTREDGAIPLAWRRLAQKA